ncbi:unnamed protein product [Caenorhabditis sp. 36 PRJEB53466]|nr:unnamed protein product [Caenorhabditis sp. 36 PRJEB53466]
MKPVLYLPYPTVRFVGVSKLRFLNGGIIFFVFFQFTSFTGWSIVELFYYRFRLIANTKLCSDWVLEWAKVIRAARVILMILTTSTTVFMTLCLQGLFDQPMYKKRLEIIDRFPELMCSSAIVLPKTSDSGIKPIHLFNSSVLIYIIVGVFLVSSMGFVSLWALREIVLHARTSMKTISMHRAFLISLFCQIGVHGFMLGFPMIVYIVSVCFHVDENDVGYVAIVIASLHGAMSTLSMILFNRPLCEVAKSKLLGVFRSNNVFIHDISFISTLRSS